MVDSISVEVAFALPEKQFLETLLMPQGSTVADVLAKSNLVNEFPGLMLDDMQAGIWGSPVERDHEVRDGDRIELYRPLELDPREARRLKAGS